MKWRRYFQRGGEVFSKRWRGILKERHEEVFSKRWRRYFQRGGEVFSKKWRERYFQRGGGGIFKDMERYFQRSGGRLLLFERRRRGVKQMEGGQKVLPKVW